LGRLSAARDAIAQLRAVVPHIGMDSILRNADQHELYLSGLRLAMSGAA
jgi:hypothetical protein